MEYGQELDKIKTEVTNSGKKLEDLSKLIQNLAGLTKLQESLNNFTEDNALNRIETKIDILAQTDYSELFDFSINNFKKELYSKDNTVSKKIESIEESLKQELNEKLTNSINSLKQNILTNLSNLNTEITSLSENVCSSSQLDCIYEKLENLYTAIDLIKANSTTENESTNLELIKSKINHISSKLIDYNNSIEQTINEKLNSLSFGQDFDAIKDSLKVSIQDLHSNIDNLRDIFQNTGIQANFENLQNALNYISENLQNGSSLDESSKEDLSSLKENFYRINDKLSEIIHSIQTNTGESEELNNRFESNLTHFNSCFQSIYEQFNNLDNTFKSNFIDFKACIQDVYDQFSTIDSRTDLDQIKLYVQSFSNKISSVADILETLKENGFSLDIKKIDTLEQKLDLLAQVDPCELINIFMEESKNSIEEIKNLKATIEQKILNQQNDTTKAELHEIQSKIEFLNRNTCALLDKFDNDTFEIRLINNKIFEEAQLIRNDLISHKENLNQIKTIIERNDKGIEFNEKLNSILDETQSLSNKMSDEFASLANPLSSAIELTCSLKESIEGLMAQDDAKVRKEASELLDKFDNIYKDAEANFEFLFNASKQFYEKLEDIKREFTNISLDTNSKIDDFLLKADAIEQRIQSNLSNSENTLNALKNISRFAENQINLTSESLNCIKTGVTELSEDFDFFKNDITELSSKLNKIILNEKENSLTLNNSFSELKEEINKNFEANIENLDQTNEKIVKKLSEELKTLSKKIDKTEEISSSTLETSEDMKTAIACMAEWFDTAGKLIEENNRSLKKNSIEKADSLIKRTEENLTDQIKRISDKLNRFEIRMENIEGKIEKLEVQQGNREILNVLSDILEKVELSNERSKSTELILNRLATLESKIEEIEDKKVQRRKIKASEEKNLDLVD